jgi:hypothetical protein
MQLTLSRVSWGNASSPWTTSPLLRFSQNTRWRLLNINHNSMIKSKNPSQHTPLTQEAWQKLSSSPDDVASVPPPPWHPTWFFFCYGFFFKLSLLILLFLILSWLRITTVDFLMKYYRLLHCFLAWFFFLSFFYDFFQNYFFRFYFFNIKLLVNLVL